MIYAEPNRQADLQQGDTPNTPNERSNTTLRQIGAINI